MLWFQSLYIMKASRKRNQKESWIIRTLLPDCLIPVCFLTQLLLCLLAHGLALVWKHSFISIRSSSVNSSGVLSVSSWISLKIQKLNLHPCVFWAIFTISFMISSIGSVVNPVGSCMTSEHGFLQWGFTVSGLMALTAMASSIVQTYILFKEDSSVALIILSIEYHGCWYSRLLISRLN